MGAPGDNAGGVMNYKEHFYCQDCSHSSRRELLAPGDDAGGVINLKNLVLTSFLSNKYNYKIKGSK